MDWQPIEIVPKDTQVLVRHPTWDCPAVMQRGVYDGYVVLNYCEEVLQDMDGGIFLEDEAELARQLTWAHAPN